MFELVSNIPVEPTFSEKLFDSITVTLVGMGIVFLALLTMGEIFKLLGNLFASPPAVEEKADLLPIDTVVLSEPSLEPKSIDLQQVDAKRIVLLVAAATVVLRRRVVIRRITFINHNTVSGWAEAGRISIQTSHNIQRK